ncbi:MAG: patatin-like phospholipase family protein [Solirubrobacterales bacterium]
MTYIGTVRILSIDGGGVRGILPAMMINELETRTGKPAAQLFDLIVGTSTGAMLALGLTKPGNGGRPQYSARDLVGLYEKESSKIFPRSFWHRVETAGGLIEEKYPADGLEAVLDKYFGSAKLSDALTGVMVTAYEIEGRKPWFFRSRNALDSKKRAWDFPMKLVARAATAAPTYFEPVRVDSFSRGEHAALIDGGVFANNPAMCAYVEAKAIFPDADRIVMVSLGTGEMVRPIPFDAAAKWGLLQWARPLLSVVFDGTDDTVDYQLRQLLQPRNGEACYYRFQTRLDRGNDDMDDSSRTNLLVLRLLAETLIQENDLLLDTVSRQLLSDG